MRKKEEKAQVPRKLTVRDGVDLRRLPDGLVRVETALRVDEVRREDSVDEGRLPQTRLTCVHVRRVSTPASGVQHAVIGA